MESKRVIEIFQQWRKKESILAITQVGNGVEERSSIRVVFDVREYYEELSLNEEILLGPYESVCTRDSIFNELIEWVSK